MNASKLGSVAVSMPVSRPRQIACTLAPRHAACKFSLSANSRCTICRHSSVIRRLKAYGEDFDLNICFGHLWRQYRPTHVSLRGGQLMSFRRSSAVRRRDRDANSDKLIVCVRLDDEAAYVIMQLASCNRSHLAHAGSFPAALERPLSAWEHALKVLSLVTFRRHG